MSSTTQPTTFADLTTDLRNRVRADTSATATAEHAKRYINTALLDMHIGFGEKFPWAEREGVLVTHPTYTTGTVTIATGLDFFFGTSTSWNTTNTYGQDNVRAGGKFQVSGGRERYEVIGSPTSTSASIDTIYLGENVTNSEYTYFEDEYDLASDFLRPVDLRRLTSGPMPIDLTPRTDFRRLYGDRFVFGLPTTATIVDRAPLSNTTPRRRLKLYPIPSTAIQIRYPYITSKLVVSSAGVAQEQLSADDDEPIVPLRYRHAIVLHALETWYRDKKDDTRSLEAGAKYNELLARITGDGEIGAPAMRIAPRAGYYSARARRGWRGGNRQFDVNGAWDRMEF